MEALFGLAVVVGALALLDILASRLGVDSRDGSDDARRAVPGIAT